MSPEDAVAELFARVGTNSGAATLVSEKELAEWPAAAVAAIKSQKLIVKARPPAGVVCPGCERQCAMPLHIATNESSGAVSAFVVCDKRDDINRVPIPPELRTLWRCDLGRVCAFVATSLGLRSPADTTPDGSLTRIGVAKGDKRSQMLCLRAGGNLSLVVSENSLPLAEAILFQGGSYAVDAALVRQMVDAARSADERHTPTTVRREAGKLATQEKYRVWQGMYRELNRERPGMSGTWYARQIVKQSPPPPPAVDTVRRRMK